MSALTEKNSSKTIYFVANQQRTLRGGRSSLKKTLEELEEEFSNPRVDTIIHMYCKKCSKFVTNDNNFRSSYLSQVLVGKCISKAKANGFLDFCHPPSKSQDFSLCVLKETGQQFCYQSLFLGRLPEKLRLML